MGISTVAALRDADAQTLRDRFSVVLERTVRELRGIPCADLELTPPAKQEIISSRTFSGYVQDMETLRAAVSAHASRAAEKMREQDSVAGGMSVFIQTNPFKESAQYQRASSMRLSHPSADTFLLVQAALRMLDRIYSPGYDYRKVGVMLRNLTQAGKGQMPLFTDGPQAQSTDRRTKLNATLDRINRRWGRGTAKLLVEAVPQQWQMARNSLSPAYTTDWTALAVVN